MCHQVKPYSSYNLSKSTKDGYHYRCKECMSLYNYNKRMEDKKYLAGLLGGKCQTCGYNKCLEALEFHHKEESSKLFDISKYLGKKKYKKLIEEEVLKCVLQCGNCHREKHYIL